MLDPNGGLMEVYQKFPDVAKTYVPLLEVAMRNEDTQLSLGERELIALYVSILNNCDYCVKIHSVTSSSLGIKEELIQEVAKKGTFDTADEKFKPIFELVHKMVKDVKSISRFDYDHAKKMGWNEETLISLVNVVAVYHMINLFSSSLGFEVDETNAKQTGGFVAQNGYTPVLKMLNIN